MPTTKLNIYSLINSKYLLRSDFDDLYRDSMLQEKYKTQIFQCLEVKEQHVNLAKDVEIDGYIEREDLYIVLFSELKRYRNTVFKNILYELKIHGFDRILFIGPAFAKSTYEFVASQDNIYVLSLDHLLDELHKDTYYNILGKIATNPNSKEDNTTVSCRLPRKGYPELGLPGPLHAADIYKIIQMKVDAVAPIKQESSSVINEAFKTLMNSFYAVQDIIDDGKNLTATKWNKIVKDNAINELLEENETEVDVIMNGA